MSATDEQLHDPVRRPADAARRAHRRHLLAGCCPSGSSTSAPRSTTGSPTPSSPRCCTWPPRTPSSRSPSTSTPPAARSPRRWRSTTPCSSSGRRSRPSAWARRVAPRPSCWPVGRRGGRAILPHGRVVLHQPATQGRGTIPDLILEADEVARVRLLHEEVLASAHRADAGADPAGHRARRWSCPGGRPWTTGSSTRSCASRDRRWLTEAAGQAARARASGRRDARRESPHARARARRRWRASISEDGSLRPRSTSERYCMETPARPATSMSRSPRWCALAAARGPRARATAAREPRRRSAPRPGNARISPMDRT